MNNLWWLDEAWPAEGEEAAYHHHLCEAELAWEIPLDALLCEEEEREEDELDDDQFPESWTTRETEVADLRQRLETQEELIETTAIELNTTIQELREWPESALPMVDRLLQRLTDHLQLHLEVLQLEVADLEPSRLAIRRAL